MIKYIWIAFFVVVVAFYGYQWVQEKYVVEPEPTITMTGKATGYAIEVETNPDVYIDGRIELSDIPDGVVVTLPFRGGTEGQVLTYNPKTGELYWGRGD
jgi:hypothetical protein